MFNFVSDVKNKTEKSFLSFDSDGDGQICENIPVALKGTYQMDLYGNWSNEESFDLSRSIYEIKFEGKSISLDDYQNSIALFKDKLQSTDEKLKTRDTAYAATAWTSFIVKDERTKMSLVTTANVQSIFKTAVLLSPTVTGRNITDNKSYTCSFIFGINNFKSLKVTDSGEKLTANFGSTKFKAPICSGIIDPVAFGYVGIGTFDIDFDLRSVIVAMSLNYGIIDVSDLTPNKFPYSEDVYQDFAALGNTYINPYYPGNIPKRCSLVDSIQLFTSHFLYFMKYVRDV